MANETVNTREYSLSDRAKQNGVKCIYDRPGSDTKVVVQFDDEIEITVYFEDEVKATERFREEAKSIGVKKEKIQAAVAELQIIKNKKMQELDLARQEKEQREKET